MSTQKPNPYGLYDPSAGSDSCGVGFITRKDGEQTHEILRMAHSALCTVPHRGGMSAEGVGDGAGVNVDLSLNFFRKVTGLALEAGRFGVGNFFVPKDAELRANAERLVEETLAAHNFPILVKRDMPLDGSVTRPAALQFQLPIVQWIFAAPQEVTEQLEFERQIYRALLDIEARAFTESEFGGLYPLSLSSRTQVFKARLNSNEVIPYFKDLTDADHQVRGLFFHTRFSTNTDPHTTMAQPFRLMAHNGELNTDRKNRIAEAALMLARGKKIVRPKGQSDSSRLDQSIHSRLMEDNLDLINAVVSMMPPAWENDTSLSNEVRAMLEYFSLYEEKNDGPAALIFGNGEVIGARLDRLGLRPLRSVETAEYIGAMSEAGQIAFPPESVLRRGRIEAGGMLYYDHKEKRSYTTVEALEKLAAEKDYLSLLGKARIDLADLPEIQAEQLGSPLRYRGDLKTYQRFVAYYYNQESFKFMMDPMLQTGAEKISAMGYGNAINGLSDHEGGMAHYFSQRFAQVTNPPLDSIREADGMTLRVALGAKPHLGRSKGQQIIVPTPILTHLDMLRLREQTVAPYARFEMLYEPVVGKDIVSRAANANALEKAIDDLAQQVVDFARQQGGIAVITDRHISSTHAAIPMLLMVSAINQRLVQEGLRLDVSLVVESGQSISSHHIAATLGFGASAVYPLGVQMRAEEKFGEGEEGNKAFKRYAKAAEKALMKTMGKVGLCTVESYSCGEFFEPNFLNTDDPVLKKYFPNIKTPVGGAGFPAIAQMAVDWHQSSLKIQGEAEVPLLGLFKERAEGAGHSYGTIAVRTFIDMTEQPIRFANKEREEDNFIRLMTLAKLDNAFNIKAEAFKDSSFERIPNDVIDTFAITPDYRQFSGLMHAERKRRPAALRDILALPCDLTHVDSEAEFGRKLGRYSLVNNGFATRGLKCEAVNGSLNQFELRLIDAIAGLKPENERLEALVRALKTRFTDDIESSSVADGVLHITAYGKAADYLSLIFTALPSLPLEEIQPAHEITRTFASGAMSHGALVAPAHEAVAHGTNMVGGMSNCGEGGEHYSRHGTIRASRIKQLASGRFGVWAAYLADPMLEELEIKIGQGAKPGEGGQLPAPKVTVEIAAARGGTPGVELVSPPPHHDTYSIEDLAQLIHDCKAARVRVIVKLVSSEGIGTIAVGVAKAGADVINVAGNTGGTGAASVTSLKYTGRVAEIGIAEVHQALCANGLRDKVQLRCSGAQQTGSDVIKSALLGGDSFEFGTTALMMLKCVMAKNCNVKCPAGLTTNAEAFDGDPRQLAQYFINVAQEVREFLARLGLRSLREARGRSDLLHLMDHPLEVGKLDLRAMLTVVPEQKIAKPVYLEKDFELDDGWVNELKTQLVGAASREIALGAGITLNNRNKSVGGQLAIDIERMLNHELPKDQLAALPAVMKDDRGRHYLAPRSVLINTSGSAGQSFGAFCNDGMQMKHYGTCNDGVGKGQCGGELVVMSPGGGAQDSDGNVLIGNFALFGATGGRLFVQGQAGDRFAVRNSGATAVVEGVGDFCCEYMTNGAILNLGTFGKGFGNGMSGGFAYQYDPYGSLAAHAAGDSVLFGSIADDDEMAQVHKQAVLTMLNWHLEATQSPRAAWLLDNWETECHHFVYVMPRSLLLYQDGTEILKAKSRKDLLEELSTSLAAHQVTKFKSAWRDGKTIANGAVPAYGATDTLEMFVLLNNYTVLSLAQQLALGKLPKGTAVEDPAVEKAVRNLLMTEDFTLISRLQRHARSAIESYSDDELASLIAAKRMADYKAALTQRNIRSMDSLATYGWIIYQDACNREVLGHLPDFEELFARAALPEIAAAVGKLS
ncbi:glutamate synthase (NADPH/NADH) large chain [Candidatus Pantoea symbiotica]|jgi:glutamate synthase (NADPH/NADH) large chain|uniref:Glutamate synthase (NADPH/NADH) large chain n=1 Tax=Candidatus Pantoea symbiotica TaxID=1884370 RepID=A0A1I3XDY9_9GAMM|nr:MULTISPECIES: glutamate synthase-related protein [Pantoea]KAJ9434439.1 glutamate synthase-related protein [Pantoea sp. YR343]MRT23797.1 glutamate synthase large subunit [Enterobacteriaceae bacterium RIT697]SFK17266.1 glutamate synthase (NADPH/NADH) large chain [Pantoea symbiotica]SFU78958.1 glutamate synthase (NADPH/NADH) large chain [Pantoea sp. YR525]